MYKQSCPNDESGKFTEQTDPWLLRLFVNCTEQTQSRIRQEKPSFCLCILLTKEFIFSPSTCYQIYAPRLDDPSSGTFESCSSDSFQINGPCAYQICYVYLYRSGSSGWKPESVKINGYSGGPVTFYYNTFIPRDTWYGFNLCNDAASSYKVSAQKWLLLVILGFVLSFWL